MKPRASSSTDRPGQRHQHHIVRSSSVRSEPRNGFDNTRKNNFNNCNIVHGAHRANMRRYMLPIRLGTVDNRNNNIPSSLNLLKNKSRYYLRILQWSVLYSGCSSALVTESLVYNSHTHYPGSNLFSNSHQTVYTVTDSSDKRRRIFSVTILLPTRPIYRRWAATPPTREPIVSIMPVISTNMTCIYGPWLLKTTQRPRLICKSTRKYYDWAGTRSGCIRLCISTVRLGRTCI